MDIIKAIQIAMKKKEERKHQYLYWCIDIHGVLLSNTYTIDNKGAKYLSISTTCMREISEDPSNKIILWSSSHNSSIINVKNDLLGLGVRVDFINCNPDCPSTNICNFDEKFYFDILLDDKAGFEPQVDWCPIYHFLRNKENYLGLDEK